MTPEELNKRKQNILQEIETLIRLQEEACTRAKASLAFIAYECNLHPLHLKAFASEWKYTQDLVEKLKEIAVEDIEYSKRARYAPRTVKAIPLQDTQYKSSNSDPDVYWTKPKAKIVLDRLGKGAFNNFGFREAKQKISKLFRDYEEMKNDNVIEALKKAVYIASTMERENNE